MRNPPRGFKNEEVSEFRTPVAEYDVLTVLKDSATTVEFLETCDGY